MGVEQGSLWEPQNQQDQVQIAKSAEVLPAKAVASCNEVYTDAYTDGYVYPSRAPLLETPVSEVEPRKTLDGVLWQNIESHKLYTTGEEIVTGYVSVTTPGCIVTSPFGAIGEHIPALQELQSGQQVTITGVHRQWFITTAENKRKQQIGYFALTVLVPGEK